ncbi:hypothetical protein I7I48_11557 [Histoplasma ohiense]|nr:hypothetical protein I7I48_11557 [Histoplasma ohiense (nom. inval.)]
MDCDSGSRPQRTRNVVHVLRFFQLLVYMSCPLNLLNPCPHHQPIPRQMDQKVMFVPSLCFTYSCMSR